MLNVFKKLFERKPTSSTLTIPEVDTTILPLAITEMGDIKLDLKIELPMHTYLNITELLLRVKPIILDEPAREIKSIMEENRNNWALPNEITLHIFLYCDVKTIAQLMLTCRHFLEMANDINVRTKLDKAKHYGKQSFHDKPHIPSMLFDIHQNSWENDFSEATNEVCQPGEKGFVIK